VLPPFTFPYFHLTILKTHQKINSNTIKST
jgi:hypothetical protein